MLIPKLFLNVVRNYIKLFWFILHSLYILVTLIWCICVHYYINLKNQEIKKLCKTQKTVKRGEWLSVNATCCSFEFLSSVLQLNVCKYIVYCWLITYTKSYDAINWIMRKIGWILVKHEFFFHNIEWL